MDPRLQPYLPSWEEPDWEETPSVSVRGLRERFPRLDPRRATRQELGEAVVRYAREVGIYTGTLFGAHQLQIDCDTCDQQGWKAVFFVCPFSQARVQELHIVDRRLVSRSALRSPAIRSRFHDARLLEHIVPMLMDGGCGLPAEIRKLLVAELERIDGGGRPDVEAVLMVTRAEITRLEAREAAKVGREARTRARTARQRAEAAERIAKLKADRLGIWAALRRAEGRGRALARRRTEGLSLEPLPGVELLDSRPPSPFQGPKAPLQDVLHVDARVLRREARYWRGGQLTVVALTEGVLMGVDLRAGEEPHVRFAFRCEGRPRLQRVPLALDQSGGEGRPRFVCRLDGPVQVLALRGGQFASVAAQRLLRPSEVKRRPGMAGLTPEAAPSLPPSLEARTLGSDLHGG